MRKEHYDTDKTRELNDQLRKSILIGDSDKYGQVITTSGITALPERIRQHIASKVGLFKDFGEEDDPYNEHDFGSFDYGAMEIFWKIDYYDTDYECLSEDPADPQKTARVLTILRAEEW